VRFALPLLLPLLPACAGADNFRVAGYQQDEFTNNADILFVIDNSSSMGEENQALIDNLGVFIEELSASGASGSDGLVDAVDNYIEFSSQGTRFINFNIGVTSTDVAASYGALTGADPLVTFGEDDVVATFQANVEEAATLSGSGNEEGLEAVFMAMCRAVENPPEPCFDEIDQFTEADILSNEGLIRERGALIPVIVSDEGDVSRRRDSQLEGAPDDQPDEYEALYALFGKRMGWAVIGPTPGVCEGATPVPEWTADRYEYMVERTDGIWVDINTGAPDCGVTDFADALEQIGELVNRLLDSFPLQAVPDPDTIRVFVEGRVVERATGDGLGGWTNGWSYDATANAIVFHGSAVPGYGAQVEIYYLPVSGEPRDLPF